MMGFNITNEDYIKSVIDILFKRYGKVETDFYLLRYIVLGFRYDLLKAFATEEEIIKEFFAVKNLKAETFDMFLNLVIDKLKEDSSDIPSNAFLEYYKKKMEEDTTLKLA